MRALVTGGTGFVGGALVRALVASGAQVRVLARPTSQTEALENLGVEALYTRRHGRQIDRTRPAGLSVGWALVAADHSRSTGCALRARRRGPVAPDPQTTGPVVGNLPPHRTRIPRRWKPRHRGVGPSLHGPRGRIDADDQLVLEAGLAQTPTSLFPRLVSPNTLRSAHRRSNSAPQNTLVRRACGAAKPRPPLALDRAISTRSTLCPSGTASLTCSGPTGCGTSISLLSSWR